MDDPHFGFILAAFVLAAVIMSALALWIILDYRHVTRALSALEQSGTRRRSDGERG